MSAPFLVSVRDALVIAWFHLLRAVRTRSAAVLAVVVLLVHMGGAWGFIEILKHMENAAATALKVPTTDRPGAMLEVLKGREDFQRLMDGLLPDSGLMEWAMSLPYLSIVHFWIALILLPFIAAAAGSEVLSADIKSRALRFETVRTGRMEIVAGRFMGQGALIFFAVLLANLGTWLMAMVAMVEQPAVVQMVTLLEFTPRLCAWSLPFLGLGVTCSMITANPNVARVLSLGVTVATFVAAGVLEADDVRDFLDLTLPLFEMVLPQSQMMALWDSGLGWVVPSLILVVFGGVATMVGFPFFARRNL